MMLVWILLVQSTMAAPQSWLLGNVEIVVEAAPHGGLINPSCLKRPSCQALAASTHKISESPVQRGGKNPGSSVCSENHKGQVVIATRGDETQAFCRFRDGSFASLGALIK